MAIIQPNIFEERSFSCALIVSLMLHILVLNVLSSSKAKIFRKPAQQIEVVYRAVRPEKVKKVEPKFKAAKVVKENKIPKEVDILSKKERQDVYSEITRDLHDTSKFSDKIKLNKKRSPTIRTLDIERKITVPLLKSEKITNPRYLSYNQSIRQKIRQRAYMYVDHPDFEAGEVYVTFIVNADGTLRQIKIIEDRTTANSYLRSVGIRSVEESGNFPPFPDDLNYPELTFNVVISFEIKD